MAWLIKLVAEQSDAVILATGAFSTAALALGVSMLSRRAWFEPRGAALEAHAKLAEVVHGSLLAFAVFVLALVLSDVRANQGKADDAALREASIASRLNRDLQAIDDPSAVIAREKLKDYVLAATTDEWRMLGGREPALSPQADRALTALVADVRRVAAAHPDLATTLRTHIDRLEELRQGRLESATKTVPSVFWWMIGAFLLGAMIMNGRHPIDWEGGALIVLHMAAIGLVVALIVVMDEPFRGETSISPAPLAKSLGLGPPR